MIMLKLYTDCFQASQEQIQTWESEMFFHGTEEIHLKNIYNDNIYAEKLEYTVNYNINSNLLYVVYRLQTYGTHVTQKYYITDKNKDKLSLKLHNIFMDKVIHYDTIFQVQERRLKTFPEITLSTLVKRFGA